MLTLADNLENNLKASRINFTTKCRDEATLKRERRTEIPLKAKWTYRIVSGWEGHHGHGKGRETAPYTVSLNPHNVWL